MRRDEIDAGRPQAQQRVDLVRTVALLAKVGTQTLEQESLDIFGPVIDAWHRFRRFEGKLHKPGQ